MIAARVRPRQCAHSSSSSTLTNMHCWRTLHFTNALHADVTPSTQPPPKRAATQTRRSRARVLPLPTTVARARHLRARRPTSATIPRRAARLRARPPAPAPCHARSNDQRLPSPLPLNTSHPSRKLVQNGTASRMSRPAITRSSASMQRVYEPWTAAVQNLRFWHASP